MKTGDIVSVTCPFARQRSSKAVLIETTSEVFDTDTVWKVVFLGEDRVTTSYILESSVERIDGTSNT